VLLIGAIIAGLWPEPAPVETAKVVTGPLRSAVTEEGKTRVKQRFIVSAPVAGQLRRIPFKAGAVVKENETVLAVIEPLAPALLDARSRSLAEAGRDAALANLERANASQIFAASELRRMQKLAADKTISTQELETAQWRETAAAKELAAAQGTFRKAEAELLESSGGGTKRMPVEIRAPAGGAILRVIEENARVVASGTALLEIGNPADLEVVIEVLSRDGAAIQPGGRVELDQWGGAEPLEARVRLVEPAAFTKISALGVEEQRVNVVADLTTPPERRPNLGDHFRVEARIITWEAAAVLKAPAGAVFRRGQQWAAFVVRDGRARFQPVTTGRSSGTETQITAGLSAGDEVVVYPGDHVRDGQRLRTLRISNDR
jgi:HlyD family secretion protein